MSDPKRLVDEGDFGASLLASARDDRPSGPARDRVALTIGLAAGATALGAASTATAATAAASGAAGAAGASGSLAPPAIPAIGALATGGGASAGAGALGAAAGGGAKIAGTALWIKLVAGGVLTAAIAGGVARVAAPPSSAGGGSELAAPPSSAGGASELAAPPSSAVTEPEGPVDPSVSPPAEALAGTDEAARAVSRDDAPALRRGSGRSGGAIPPRRSEPNAAPPAETPLARELRSLDVAREALARGDATTALRELDRHERQFHGGALKNEAALLRAEALLASGNAAAARAIARDLLERDPSGPHARRLRTLAGSP